MRKGVGEQCATAQSSAQPTSSTAAPTQDATASLGSLKMLIHVKVQLNSRIALLKVDHVRRRDLAKVWSIDF